MLPARLARGAIVVRAERYGVAWREAPGAWVLPIVRDCPPRRRSDVACQAGELSAESTLSAANLVVRIAQATPLHADHEVRGAAAASLVARIAAAIERERLALAGEQASSIGIRSLDRPHLPRGRKVGGPGLR